ncbi:MAG: universal stress protein [Rhodospirillales bacterium]|nr:universal stress protein [Rhodospirillales bacterium]
MAYRDVLVVVDDTPERAQRMQFAARLAARHEAHLIGMMLRYGRTFAERTGAYVVAADEKRRRAAEDAAHTRIREELERQARAAGVPVEWYSADGEPVRTVSLFCRHADIAVIGQSVDQPHALGTVRDLAEHVALASGRPVVTVPRAGTPAGVGDRVMVAWDAGREAARAVADSLPVLQRAEQVLIYSVDPEERGDRHGEVPGADLARHLARHDVDARVETVSGSDADAGDLILNRIAEAGIDLLVMGAYGHTRIRELWLGGVTRQMMRNMTVPVLLSH